MDISFTLPTFSMPAAATETKKADAGKDKKKVDTSNEPGICTRVWEAVKYVLATIWSVAATGIYYLSCKCIDVRPSTAPKLMFANQKGFHELTTAPKGEAEMKAFRAKLEKQFHAAHKASYPGFDPATDIKAKVSVDPFVDVLVKVISEASSKGLTPVEYRFTINQQDYNFTLEIFAPKDAKKLPEWKAADFGDMSKAFLPPKKWSETKVTIDAPKEEGTKKGKTEAKATKSKSVTVECQVYKFTTNVNALPVTVEGLKASKDEFETQLLFLNRQLQARRAAFEEDGHTRLELNHLEALLQIETEKQSRMSQLRAPGSVTTPMQPPPRPSSADQRAQAEALQAVVEEASRVASQKVDALLLTLPGQLGKAHGIPEADILNLKTLFLKMYLAAGEHKDRVEIKFHSSKRPGTTPIIYVSLPAEIQTIPASGDGEKDTYKAINCPLYADAMSQFKSAGQLFTPGKLNLKTRGDNMPYAVENMAYYKVNLLEHAIPKVDAEA